MNIIFLGPPGSGKGTYASRISEQKGWAHISTGDILREEVKKETELGKKANEYMKRGDLVPDELVIEMLKNRIKEKDCEKGFILDGFPRTIKQAEELEKMCKIDIVINLILPDEVIIKKLSGRRICSACGDIYNVADIKFGKNNEYSMPPLLPKKEGICDKCGGSLIKRKDDEEEIIRERLLVYRKQTQPLIDYYSKKGLLKDMEVTGPPDVVIPKILAVLEGK